MTNEEMKNKPMNRKTAIALIVGTFSKVINSEVTRTMCLKCLTTLGVSEKEFSEIEIEMGEKVRKM
ncbi:MAG: hypothetical protein ACTSRU_10800 [Candidatus Hodarchaeales archaeon]